MLQLLLLAVEAQGNNRSGRDTVKGDITASNGRNPSAEKNEKWGGFTGSRNPLDNEGVDAHEIPNQSNGAGFGNSDAPDLRVPDKVPINGGQDERENKLGGARPSRELRHTSLTPPPLPSPSPPPSPFTTHAACTNTCSRHARDGFCDDGGPGAEYQTLCDLGTDCEDCGPRVMPPPTLAPCKQLSLIHISEPTRPY